MSACGGVLLEELPAYALPAPHQKPCCAEVGRFATGLPRWGLFEPWGDSTPSIDKGDTDLTMKSASHADSFY